VKAPQRFPLTPFLAFTSGSLKELGRRAGISGAQITRDHKLGGATPRMAEQIAVAFGRTPGEIWGDLWWDLPDGTFGPVDLPTAEQAEQTARAARRRAALAGTDRPGDNTMTDFSEETP
jgi:lambda repressor-like predicted transcriptional regulator